MKKALKRSLSLLLAITIIFGSAYVGLAEVDFGSIFAVEAKAAATSGTTGDCTWTLDGTVLTISGNCVMGNYSPSSKAPWGTAITEVIIEDGVTSIGEYAFWQCQSLASITIPDSVIRICDDAFYNCDGLTSITIPDSVTSLGVGAFYDCNGLNTITIPDSVTSIGDSAFNKCSNLTSITIPDSVTSIGGEAFYQCTSLTSINIPDSVTSIGGATFYLCVRLKSVTIGKSVTSIGVSAFYNCTKLADVYYEGSEEQWNEISVGSYNASLTSATIHYSFVTEKNGSFNVVGEENSHKYSYNYKDSYFDNPATEYNHELATMSLCLALSTGQSETQKITYQNAEKLLKDCGFDGFETYNYDFPTETNDIACIIGYKKIADETLIAVAVRSSGYYKEWSSNFKIGETGDHNGFDEAATKVSNEIENYINTYKSTFSGNVKLWLCGYSRGAATATQTAAKINGKTIGGIKFPKENVYAYGFATPAGAIKDNDPTNLDKYGNIFSIINFHDIVPKVAPQDWGYMRYGTTLYLPFSENSTKAVQAEKNVKKWFKENGFTYKVQGLFDDESNNDLTLSKTSLGFIDLALIEALLTIVGTKDNYVNNLQGDMCKLLGYLMSEKGDYSSKNSRSISFSPESMPNDVSKEYGKIKYILELSKVIFIEQIPLLIKPHAVYGAYYLGWMQTLPSDNALSYMNDGSYRRWLINCPVDTYVYDKSGALVAAIENDIPIEIEGSAFSYGIDNNGQKFVYLPIDGEYDIKVVAREECKTTCTVNEFSGGSLTECRITTFTGIPMENGEELSVSTGAYSENDIVNGTENGSSAEYSITTEDNQIIEADVDVTGEEIENYAYNVTVEYDDNNGIVYGGGEFTIGQFCQVTAENKPGYKFSKWTVNGETVSTESTYRFAVTEDVTIVAEYVLCEHPKYKAEVVAPTCTVDGYTKHTCEICTHSYNDTVVKANGHSASDWIVNNKTNTKHKECTVCGEVLETQILGTIFDSGTCGENITWKLDDAGVLTISGTGAMFDYKSDNSPFRKSYAIKSVILEDGITHIGEYAFRDCRSLISITIPSSVTSIGLGAFQSSLKLTSVTIPKGVTKIENCTFDGCSGLTSILIPDNVSSIGDYAFRDCQRLTSVTIPDSVTSIGYMAFYRCLNLTEVNFGNDLIKIGQNAFDSCEKLNSLIIPESVTVIGSEAFSNCTSLVSLSVLGETTKIITNAFSNCTKLSVIKIPGVADIGEDVFLNTAFYNNSSNWDNGVLYISGHLIKVKDTFNGTCSIKTGTKSIAACAFKDCNDLISVTIPDSVINIGYEAFSNCTRLSSITIPSNVKSIGYRAFQSCYNLLSITIPDSVNSIGEEAFEDTAYYNKSSNWINGILYINNHLILADTSINGVCSIRNSTKTIAEEAFSACEKVTSIIIPNSVRSIGWGAFSGCSSLSTTYYSGSKAQWNNISIGDFNECLYNNIVYNYVPKPATPKVTTTNEIGGVQVKWNAVAGATKYVVFRRQGGYNTWVNVGTTTGTTLLDKNVKSGIYYVYSVRAYNSSGQYSDFVSANTQTRKFMATPKLTTIYNHVNGLAIKWNAVAGVTNGYRVYRRGAGSTYWTYLGTTKNLYFIDSQVKNKSGEYFRYTVIADGGYHSKFDTTGLYLKRLANPTLTSAVSSTAGITVKWGAVKGTTGYYVYRKTANSTWVRVGTVGGTNNTTFLDKTAKKGTTYTYTVKAVYGATTSAYNSGISCYDKY